MTDYLRDGAAIYRQSFAIIRAEADLSRFSEAEADVAVRMLHSCGMVEIAEHIVFAAGVVAAARQALGAGAAILCDSEMVSHGVTRARLPADNEVICTLRDPRVPRLAETLEPPARPPRWSYGAIGWEGPSSRSAMRPLLCSGSWICSMREPRVPPSSWAFRSASSEPWSRRKRSSRASIPSLSSPCGDGSAEAP